MAKEIYIIRHGQTDYNLKGIVQGRGVNSSLNETGKLQSERFFQQYKNYHFEKIFISALKRTLETVEPFIEKLKIPFEVHPELDEIDWGAHEGKKSDHILKLEYSRILNSWSENLLHISTPCGETPLELQSRQQIFLNHLIEQPEKRILICTHGRAMRSLLCTMTGSELCRMEDFPHNNLSLYKVLYYDGSFKIDIFNSRDHLHND